jgi:hypothetical protein
VTGRDDMIDRYLAGEVPAEALTESERAEEARLRELLGAVRDDARARTGFRAGVMRAIEHDSTPLWKRLAGWWIEPRPVRIRPAVGALAMASAVLLFVWSGRSPEVDTTVVSTPVQQVTRFVLVAPNASSVHLTGDFVGWSPEGIALADPRGTGVWTADVPLPPGVYQYTFVLDGTEWIPDPRAVSQVDDGFGQVNSVVIVPGEEA